MLSPGTVAWLREYQTRQKVEKAAAAETWEEQGFVFASPLGHATHPDVLSNTHDSPVKLAGVKPIRFHELRHTAASLMISKGIPPKTVSERLGYADVAFTLRTYTHLYAEQREEAALDLSDPFPVASGGPN